jgi:phosphoenolpyruvate carboxykinase (ATP)
MMLIACFRVAELYEYALLPEHLTSVDPHIYPTTVTDTGALSVSSGSKTGRTPKEKRVVLDETTKDVSSYLSMRS